MSREASSDYFIFGNQGQSMNMTMSMDMVRVMNANMNANMNMNTTAAYAADMESVAEFPIVGSIVGVKHYFQDMNILSLLIIRKR
jgi:hypothetical protein